MDGLVWGRVMAETNMETEAKRDALTLARAEAIRVFDTYWTLAEHDIAILEEAEAIRRDNKRWSASEKVTRTILKPGKCWACGDSGTIRYGRCFTCTFGIR